MGTLVGPQLQDRVTEALDKACPPNLSGNFCQEDPFIIDSIPTLNGNCLDANASLSLSIKGAKFLRPHNRLREALVAAVAGVFRVMSEDDKNCYWVTAGGSRLRFYNVGNYVEIGVRSDAGEDAFLCVGLEFEKATTAGNFDCVAIIERTARMLEELTPQFAGSLHVMAVGHDYACIHNNVTSR